MREESHMKNKTIIFSTALLMLSGLVLSGVDFNFVPALAEEVIVEGSFANITSYNANGSFYFTMAENDAPFNDWSIRYKPESVDNITITQPDGTSYHIESAITQREAIVKYGADKYEFESWVYGSTRKPQEGDLVTIEGNFVRTDGGTVTKLNIQKSSFLIGKDSNNALYPINIPQTITNVSEKSTGFSMSSKTWWFLFNIKGLSEEDAPITGDSYGYYPSSKECVYFNGNPIGKVDKHALRRRDADSTEFYVVKQGYGEGQDFEPNVGDVVVFDGLFVKQDGRNTHLENIGQIFALHAAGIVYHIRPERGQREARENRDDVNHIHRRRLDAYRVADKHIAYADYHVRNAVDDEFDAHTAHGDGSNLPERNKPALGRGFPVLFQRLRERFGFFDKFHVNLLHGIYNLS